MYIFFLHRQMLNFNSHTSQIHKNIKSVKLLRQSKSTRAVSRDFYILDSVMYNIYSIVSANLGRDVQVASVAICRTQEANIMVNCLGRKGRNGRCALFGTARHVKSIWARCNLLEFRLSFSFRKIIVDQLLGTGKSSLFSTG